MRTLVERSYAHKTQHVYTHRLYTYRHTSRFRDLELGLDGKRLMDAGGHHATRDGVDDTE